jgi:hypothetical protein
VSVNMESKVQYVHRKWRQVVIPFTFVAILALLFVVFSLLFWVTGNPSYVEKDLFKFCMLIIGFYLPFYGFLSLIKYILITILSKS